jgi:hypothetical protein
MSLRRDASATACGRKVARVRAPFWEVPTAGTKYRFRGGLHCVVPGGTQGTKGLRCVAPCAFQPAQERMLEG